jgi:hypothetical protein
MNTKHMINLNMIIVFFIISTLIFNPLINNNKSQNLKDNELTNQIKFPDIKELEMKHPPETPLQNFNDYISKNPYTDAKFTQIKTNNNQPVTTQNQISILVNNDLNSKIQTKLQQYIIDLEKEGYYVHLETLTGGNPQSIKNWIQNRYNSGTEGFVLIGNIPAAWAEVSGSTFPSDLYYMDLDGLWEDNNNDDIFESHTAGSGDMGPEVYIGRMYATSLNWETEETMINEYLEKTHDYRNNELIAPWRGLEYVDEDWYTMQVNLNNIYFDNVTRYDFGYSTTAADYLTKLQEGYHFVTVCAHSFPQGHHFSTKPTEAASYANVYIYSPIQRQAKIHMGCDDGIKIWLNNEHIYTKEQANNWMADRYKIDITLNQGWNQLLCKISQIGGDYEFSIKITDTNSNLINDLKYQTIIPDNNQITAPYIRSWLINGFHQDNPDNFYSYLTTNYLNTDESTIHPIEGQTTGGKTWTKYNVGYPYIDINKYSNAADYGATYAYVKINSQTDKTCQLWLGYDDGARIWLNNEEILFDNRYGGFTTDKTKIDVTLNTGENHLLIKLSEWMGENGFTARLATNQGLEVEGLTYSPEMQTISHIGTWLINGVYENKNYELLLSTDHLNGETQISPNEGDEAPIGTWQRGIGNGRPFNLLTFFDHGEYVLSEKIQQEDPPCLFYNLFSCGPGRFTDENYLAGSYIFNTNSGLITIASSKSGSMLNFQDFTKPLGEGKNIGEAFQEWFDIQAPYALWEKEWYYGMVICGDPTLKLYPTNANNPVIKITKPENGIYFKNEKILPFIIPTIIGNLTINTDIISSGYGISQISFYINNELINTDNNFPFEFQLNEQGIGLKEIKIIGIDNQGQEAIDEKNVLIINLGILS